MTRAEKQSLAEIWHRSSESRESRLSLEKVWHRSPDKVWIESSISLAHENIQSVARLFARLGFTRLLPDFFCIKKYIIFKTI